MVSSCSRLVSTLVTAAMARGPGAPRCWALSTAAPQPAQRRHASSRRLHANTTIRPRRHRSRPVTMLANTSRWGSAHPFKFGSASMARHLESLGFQKGAKRPMAEGSLPCSSYRNYLVRDRDSEARCVPCRANHLCRPCDIHTSLNSSSPGYPILRSEAYSSTLICTGRVIYGRSKNAALAGASFPDV